MLTRVLLAIIVLTGFTPARLHAQVGTAPPDSTIDTTVEAGQGDPETPPRKWNEYHGSVSSIRLGFGFLVDGNAFVQDDNSKQQIHAVNKIGVRDFRLLLRGKFTTKRPLSWSLGYMYDGADDQWHFRQTGLMIGVPELSGSFFVGRTKEGFSLIKVMTGYYIWGVERAPISDAFVPILGDGIKYMGWYPRSRIFVNLGAFADGLSEDEKFATADHQVVWRVGWHPILSEDKRTVWQFAVMGREFRPDEGKIQPKSRPEAYLAPYYLDAGKFASDHGRTTGIESYYRHGPWMVGGEYNWQLLHDDVEGDNALFHGGFVSIVKEITGETRPYNAAGSFFEEMMPKRSVFAGGHGNLEATLTYSYTDMDSGRFQGGKFWRISPILNWNLSYNLRLSLEYGYGKLDRFGLDGATQFFQFRILTML